MSGPGMQVIGEEGKREVLEVLDSGYLFRYGSPDDPAFTAKVYKLEQAVAALVGVRYGVAINLGTTALLVALSGLGVGLGAAVLLAQLRKLDAILGKLRANKRRFKAALGDLPGLEFREITDPDGECATLLTVFLPTEEVARKIAAALGTRVVADSGWHVYANMEQVLDKRTITPEGCPFTCPYYKGEEVKYGRGMLPQTDALLARAINIAIGVWDPGLGASFGVTIRDDCDAVDAKAAEFRRVAGENLA